jgi:hypothetical protein
VPYLIDPQERKRVAASGIARSNPFAEAEVCIPQPALYLFRTLVLGVVHAGF